MPIDDGRISVVFLFFVSSSSCESEYCATRPARSAALKDDFGEKQARTGATPLCSESKTVEAHETGLPPLHKIRKSRSRSCHMQSDHGKFFIRSSGHGHESHADSLESFVGILELRLAGPYQHMKTVSRPHWAMIQFKKWM